MEKNYTDVKAKDKKLESVENARRDSQQIGPSEKGTEVSTYVFFVSMKSDREDIPEWVFSFGDFIARI